MDLSFIDRKQSARAFSPRGEFADQWVSVEPSRLDPRAWQAFYVSDDGTQASDMWFDDGDDLRDWLLEVGADIELVP